MSLPYRHAMGAYRRGVVRSGLLAICVASAILSPDRVLAQAMDYVRKDTARETFEASMAVAREKAIRLGPWQVIGPMPVELGKSGATPHPLEKVVDLSAAWPGKDGGQVKWRSAEPLADGRVNDMSALVKDAPCVSFLYRVIESAGDYELPLLLGSSEDLAVFLNGNKVHSRHGSRKAKLGDDRVTIKLRKGNNDLLVRVTQGAGEAGFAFAAGAVVDSPRFQDQILSRLQQDFPGEFRAFCLELELNRQWADLAAHIRNRGQFKDLAAQTFRADAGIFDTDRDGLDVVLRRTQRLLDDMAQLGERPGFKPNAARMARALQTIAAVRPQLEQLKAEAAKVDPAAVEQRQALYLRVCHLRRMVAFANPLLDFDSILFVKRERNPNSEGQGHHMCDQFFGFNARNIPGGGVYVLDRPFSDSPTLRNLLENSPLQSGPMTGRKLDSGSFLAPEISYDARTVMFAHSWADPKGRRWSEERSWHIFSANIDGSDLRQITEGDYNDFDPCYMPDGRVVFISERRGGFGRCHGRPVPVYTLHTMNPDGSDIVCISYHESNEWQPSINHDGMIVYTRWDYVDRHFNIAHHPWITTPDGRDARAIHGNYPPGGNWGARPEMEVDIRAIPGSRKYIATTGAHHGQAYGSLVVFDPDQSDDGAMGPIRRVTPESRFPESECSTEDQPYGTAWPLNEDYHLAVWDRSSRNYALYLIDSFGNRELLYRDGGISCLSPLPIKPRPVPPVVPTISRHTPVVPTTAPVVAKGKPVPFYSIYDPDRGWAKPYAPVADAAELEEILVINVYDGRKSWPAGTQIKQLRIVEPLIKSTPGADGPMIGVGSQSSARAILGTVPVESDGSVRFLAPIQRPLLFQAIDQNGLAVQSMRSDAFVMRGTRLVCQGCHEPGGKSPTPPKSLMALGKAPARIAPEVDGTSPFSYPRLVQPVLDKHCVDCHAKNAPTMDLGRGTAALNGKNHGWYPSYVSLAKDYGFWYSNGDVSYSAFDGSNTTPGKFGAYGSKLYKVLQAGHYGVKLAPEDMHRLTLWLENNSAFYGDYQNTAGQARGEVVRPVVE